MHFKSLISALSHIDSISSFYGDDLIPNRATSLLKKFSFTEGNITYSRNKSITVYINGNSIEITYTNFILNGTRKAKFISRVRELLIGRPTNV